LDRDYRRLAWADAEERWGAKELCQPQALRRRERRVVEDEPQAVDRYAQRWAGPGWGEPEERWAVAHQPEGHREAQQAWAQLEQQDQERQAWQRQAQP